MQGRTDVAEALDTLKETYPDFDISVGLISLGLKSDQIKNALSAQKKAKHGKFEYFYLPQEDIKASYKALVDAEGGITEDKLNFESPFYKDEGDYGTAWIGTLSSKELIRLFTEHENRLFAGNVRLFLGDRKGGINEQIIKTAKENPGQFWALNNGITIVADSVSPSKNSKTLTLKRFSIVNGCQTTSCLVQAGTEKAKVLTRVIAAKAGLKNEIIRYNNSQNAVKIWAVRAADNVQEDLRAQFKQYGISYAPKQEGTKKKRGTASIELDKVAQYLAARDQNFLIQAVNNKAELFDEPYKKLFHPGIKSKEVYLAWLVGNLADDLKQQFLNAVKKSSPGDKNVGLLGIAGALWIVFCTYKLIDAFSNTDSSHITVEKMKDEQSINALKKYVETGLDMFYDLAIDSYDENEYGSFKSTLRSTKFRQKIDSKVNSKVIRLKSDKNTLPKLESTAKSIK